MSIIFSVYFSLADRNVVNCSDQWGLLRKAGLNFQSSGYYYSLDHQEIVDAPGQLVVDNFQDFDQLSQEIKLSLSQQWEHENGGALTLGYVLSGNTRIGVLRFFSSDIDMLSQSLASGEYALPQLISSLMTTLGASRLLALSDAAMSDVGALTLLLASDFSSSLGVSGLCGFGGAQEEIGDTCPSNFQNFSNSEFIMYLRWPFG